MSRFPPIVTVTVTVIGEPAVAVEGAVKSIIACGVLQANVIDIAIAAANAHNRRAEGFIPVPNRRDLPRNLTAKRAKREFALYTPMFTLARATGSRQVMVAVSIPELEVRRLLRAVVVRLAQAQIDSEQGSVNINAVVRKLWFGQIKI